MCLRSYESKTAWLRIGVGSSQLSSCGDVGESLKSGRGGKFDPHRDNLRFSLQFAVRFAGPNFRALPEATRLTLRFFVGSEVNDIDANVRSILINLTQVRGGSDYKLPFRKK